MACRPADARILCALTMVALVALACSDSDARAPSAPGPSECRVVSWCATAQAAILVASDAARNEIGCPMAVSALPAAPAPADEGPAMKLHNHPAYHRLASLKPGKHAAVDAAETQRSYEAGNPDACCYSWTPPC